MIGYNNRSHYIVTCFADIGNTKFHQKLTGFYLLPSFNPGLNGLSLQLHGIHTQLRIPGKTAIIDGNRS